MLNLLLFFYFHPIDSPTLFVTRASPCTLKKFFSCLRRRYRKVPYPVPGKDDILLPGYARGPGKGSPFSFDFWAHFDIVDVLGIKVA
jgi:hypothetical protein